MARPREFEPEEALDAIMGVFWRQGYEGTSLQDIEAATGLNNKAFIAYTLTNARCIWRRCSAMTK